MPDEHREHPVIFYGEVPFVIVVVILAFLVVAFGGKSSDSGPAKSSSVHSPTVVAPPFRDGDIILADELRTVIPGVEMKTGRKVPLRRRLPYDGAGPESASYELVAGH